MQSNKVTKFFIFISPRQLYWKTSKASVKIVLIL